MRAKAIPPLVCLAAGLAAWPASGWGQGADGPGEASREQQGPTARAGDADAARTAELIARLASAKLADREQAQRALRQIGLPALPMLRAATRDADAERAQRAQAVLRDLALRMETWRDRWEAMTLSLSIQEPADPARSLELSVNEQGHAVAVGWDPARKVPTRHEGALPPGDLQIMVRALGRMQPWSLNAIPPWPAGGQEGRISLLVTVEGQFAAIEQPWPPPREFAGLPENAPVASGLMQVRDAAIHLVSVLAREAAIRAQSQRKGPGAGGLAGAEVRTSAVPAAGEARSAVQKAIDLLDLPWQTKLTEQQLDETAAWLRPDADAGVAALLAQYNRTGNNSFRHRTVTVLRKLGTPAAGAALLDIALGRTADDLASSHRWAASAYLAAPQGDARKLLPSNDTGVLNVALLALKGTPVDEPLLQRLGEIVQRKEKDAPSWMCLRHAAANILASDPRPALIARRVEMLLGMAAQVADMPEPDKVWWPGNFTYAEGTYHCFVQCLAQMPSAADEHLTKAAARLGGAERDVVVLALAQRGDRAVREEVLRIVQDPKAGMRRAWAARALAEVGCADDLPLLRKLAESDPFQREQGGCEPPANKMMIFPVRQGAKEAIRAIQGGTEGAAAPPASTPQPTVTPRRPRER